MSRVIVTIHGTGRTPSDFWLPQVRAITAILGAVPLHQPVWWGDLIDVGAAIPRATQRVSQAVAGLGGCVSGRAGLFGLRLASAAADRLHRLANGGAGVAAYLAPTRTREAIRGRLRETLAELTRRGDEIVLISESLGCLVAFDILRREANRFNVAAWITLGCPLRTLVRSGQRRAELGAISLRTVRQWLNLYAPRDLVAAPIASVFPDYPIRDVRVEGALSRAQAHRYWSNPRTAALIARVMAS